MTSGVTTSAESDSLDETRLSEEGEQGLGGVTGEFCACFFLSIFTGGDGIEGGIQRTDAYLHLDPANYFGVGDPFHNPPERMEAKPG
jgi:hypothetical protein